MGLCQGVLEKKEHITIVLKNESDLLENCYSEVFGITDSDLKSYVVCRPIRRKSLGSYPRSVIENEI